MKSLIYLTALAMTPVHAQEYRETAVPNAQIGAVLRDVTQWHDMQHPDCKYSKSLGSVTLEKSSTGTVEHWSIEACLGKTFTYRVTVFPSANGGVTDMVSNVDGNPVGGNEKSTPPTAEECQSTRTRYDALSTKKNVTDSEMAEIPQLAADLAACPSAL